MSSLMRHRKTTCRGRLLELEQSSSSKATAWDTLHDRLSKRRTMAFLDVFDVDVVQPIHDFIPRIPDVEWEEIAGYTMIYKTKHLQTYTGGPEGSYAYVYKERRPGWYRWHRTCGREPTYTYIDDGIVAAWATSSISAYCLTATRTTIG